MSRYHEDLDYLVADVDISKEEFEEIIAEADKVIADANSEKDKLIEAYLKKVQCLQKLGKQAESKKFIDKLLDLKPNMPEAIVRLGNVYSDNKEYEKAIDCVNKAIKIKPSYAYAYHMRGYTKDDLSDYHGAIEDYNKAIEMKPEYAAAYNNRGTAKDDLSDYHGAIEDYNKAIEIKPDHAKAYNNRGNAKCNLSDYHGAIKDYNKAIEIKPEYATAYNNRGIAKSDLSDYSGAIEDYTKAIKINPNDADAYYNRGNAKYNLSDYPGAIEDYNKAIEVEPDFAKAYNNRGVAKEDLTDYYGAITDYDKAIEIKPDYELAHKNRNLTYSKIKEKHKDAAKGYIQQKTDILNMLAIVEESDGREIAKYMLDEDDFFKETTEGKENEKEDYGEIYIESLIIVSKLHVKDEIEMSVSYYTKKDVAEQLFFEGSQFRINSINTSNDPEEGKTLFHYLFPKENMSAQIEEFGAFAGCFTANNDSLNQFRLYGKAEDKEGTGVSIALNKNFFSKEIRTGVETKSELKEKKEEENLNLLPLFRCIYIDPETYRVISLGQKEEYVFYRDDKGKKDGEVEEVYQNYKSEIDKTQKDISDELIKLKKQIEYKKLAPDIVYKLLLNLRYLVKHVAFKEEQECRIIKIKKLDDKKSEEKIEIDENSRLYLEYCPLNKNNVARICLGPQVENIDKFKQRLAHKGLSGIECRQSKAPLA